MKTVPIQFEHYPRHTRSHPLRPRQGVPRAKVKAILAFHVFLFILSALKCSMLFEERACPFHEVALEKKKINTTSHTIIRFDALLLFFFPSLLITKHFPAVMSSNTHTKCHWEALKRCKSPE